MSKQSLLLVDGDTRSLRVLEVSLRKAGFSVTPAVSVGDALDKLEVNAPDLIISETKFSTELDGFELRRRLRASPDWAEIPFIFLTAETAIENKIKGLELGVDDYLTKPIYIKEIVTRINILLQKRQRQFLDLKKDGTRFAGRVADMPVVDVIQTIEISRKSGVIQFSGGPGRQAAIYFRDGKVIDAEAGTLQGEDAVYRLLTWNEGEFEVEFRTVRRREAISTSSQGLLMEGMRRLDEWSRLLEQLPPLSHRFEIDAAELAVRLGDVPDDNNRILRLFDGKRTLLEVIDASDFGDLECLQAISRLYFEGLLIDLDPDVKGTRRDTGKPMPLVVVEDSPTPIEEVASGPIEALEAPAELVAPSEGIVAAAPAVAESASVVSSIVAVPAPVVSSTVEPTAERPRMRRDSGEIVSDQEVLSEEEVPLGPLSGGYRPSSLRLIDEAVAAAQAIEPSLFEPEELAAAGVTPIAPATSAETPLARVQLAARTSDPRIDVARDLIERTPASAEPPPSPSPTNGSSPRPKSRSAPPPLPKSIAREIEEAPLLEADPYTSGEIKIPSEEELSSVPVLDADLEEEASSDTTAEDYSGVPTVIEAEEEVPEEKTDPSLRRWSTSVRRDDSQGLRMIGSHGRDRAEASGELRPPAVKATQTETAESQRELVTIMPRRITREHPIQNPDVAKGDSTEAKADAKPEAKAPPPPPPPPPKPKPAIEPPASPPARVSVAGGVVRAPSGPGKGAMILMSLAAVLVGATVVSYCTKAKPVRQPVAATNDAGEQVVEAVEDAGDEQVGFGIDADRVAVTPVDAAVAVKRADAAVVAVAPKDAAAVGVAPTVDAGVDKAKEARSLFDKAHTALEEGDPEAALDLLDQSLKLRKTSRTHLERARALQRLNRIDEAVAAVDEAISINESYAPAHEQKGMILWSAQRYGEARPALEKYLELDPNGRKAETIRGMLDEQK